MKDDHAPTREERESLAALEKQISREEPVSAGTEPYKVGRGKPPLSTRFSSTNQPDRRREGPCITAALKRELLATAPGTDRTFAEELARRLIELALEGHSRAIAEVCNRCEGAVPLRIAAEIPTEVIFHSTVPDEDTKPCGGNCTCEEDR